MQTVSIRARFAAFTAATLLGALTQSVGAQTPNTVEGTVRTADGRPLRGATIRISGATGAGRGTTIRATTGADGRYSAKVPLGHYDVDAFADLEFDGQTYKELLLDRGSATCERVMSTKGIVRNFTLRLAGAKQCLPGHDPNNPNSWHGAYITAMTSDLSDDAVITFTLTPLGRLADGTPGRALTFTRTGAALKTGAGAIGKSQYLHDIPLGRYRVAADVRYANGEREATTLELRDGGDTSGRTLDIAFHANVFGGGIRPVGIGVIRGAAVSAPDAPEPPEPEEARTPDDPPAQSASEPAPPSAQPAAPASAELPRGRYACSYRSQYAGDIPNGKSITVTPGRRYQAYGHAGTYTFDPATGSVQWTGPLGDGDVQAAFEERDGLPVITVIGGGASEDPDRTNTCVLTGAR